MNDFGFDGVIFDLDGVITKTASVHSRAWKKMFDEYLLFREQKYNEPFREFTHTNDYLPFVDGKPRYKGVEDFLKSRKINIPYGNPEDSPDTETICGLGNRKNDAFNVVLTKEGVEVFESTVLLMKTLKEKGIKIGVASSSKNCENVLKSANLLDLIETRVDGVVSAKLGLKGKPEADIFTQAADNLGVAYHKSVVVEDAVSGVKAGRNGNFGLVLGIAREENERELLINGADVVVTDIADFGFEKIQDWFKNKIEQTNWNVAYFDYNTAKEKTRESLLTVGNGYFGTRGAMEENDDSETNYPGTYIAGLYNRMESKVGDRMVENEDFVNCPNWLPVTFMINSDEWFDINKTEILEFKRNLNLKNGLLTRLLVVKDKNGNKTKIESQRIVSMSDQHLAAIKYNVTPLNYSAKINFKSILNGNVINNGVKRYRQLSQNHLNEVTQGFEENYSWVVSKTKQSEIEIAEAARLKIYYQEKPRQSPVLCYTEKNSVTTEIEIDAFKNETISLEKIVAIYTSKKDDTLYPLQEAKRKIINSGNFNEIVEKSEQEWNKIWNEADLKIEGDRKAQKLLRLHIYHLMVSMSPHNAKIDASATARGLHGEAYRGHIFWDELFILPFYNLHFPDVAKAMLMYRYNRLDKAREYAKEHGYPGAMFPWQSGSDGREETQIVHLNPLSGEWGDDYSSLQRHVSLAIAYNTWHYFNSTNDIHFLNEYGAEMFLEIARFWASKAEFKASQNQFSIANVMGPDEFHEKYPDSSTGGLKDNAYTNIMVSWVLSKAFDIISLLKGHIKENVLSKIELREEELQFWAKVSKSLRIIISEKGIISQYDGYFDLLELDWDAYRKKYSNIHRMDRILKAEGKSADNYKVAKQADTLMTFYNLPESQATTILKNMGYKLPQDYLQKNLKYYLNRTSHGSTLSKVVHAQLANVIGNDKLSWELYMDALASDFNDIQGGTTGEGIHLGVMAGTVMIAINTYAGVDFRDEILSVNPRLPKHWQKIEFIIHFKNEKYEFHITKNRIIITTVANKNLQVIVGKKTYELKPNTINKIKY
ncbi:MAG: HAD-IA family hydrolase [Chlorobi bacterium]|nr:HAD-IA family hydrolase [Chlorobiota bacterium]